MSSADTAHTQTELLDSFANVVDKDSLVELTSTAVDQNAIGFRDAIFTWSNAGDGSVTPSRRSFSLRIDEELTFQRGVLNMIVGPTGSGKTSFLMALLG